MGQAPPSAFLPPSMVCWTVNGALILPWICLEKFGVYRQSYLITIFLLNRSQRTKGALEMKQSEGLLSYFSLRAMLNWAGSPTTFYKTSTSFGFCCISIHSHWDWKWKTSQVYFVNKFIGFGKHGFSKCFCLTHLFPYLLARIFILLIVDTNVIY